MFDSDIYKDIAARSGGEIYIGVVGPVRTGKSTLIKRFMTELVLPNADGERLQEMVDELPQSAILPLCSPSAIGCLVKYCASQTPLRALAAPSSSISEPCITE